MVLKSLVDYYEVLLSKGKQEGYGWSSTQVSFGLDLNNNGEVCSLIPLITEMTYYDKKSKKDKSYLKRKKVFAPLSETKSSGIVPTFLYSNPTYMLGLNIDKSNEKTKKCFESMKELHLKILISVNVVEARAICRFYDHWNLDDVENHPEVVKYHDLLMKGAIILFYVNGIPAVNVPSIRVAWENYLVGEGEKNVKRQCAVTGKLEPLESVHLKIKGVHGGTTAGLSLVSNNKDAFESYNHKQGENSQIGKYASFAYAEALNYLTTDDETRKQRKTFGDTTLIFWDLSDNPAYASVLDFIDSGLRESGAEDTIKSLFILITDLLEGKKVDWDGNILYPEQECYFLAISPNAGRASIRFFQKNNFSYFVNNLNQHQNRLRITNANGTRTNNISVKDILEVTLNKKDKNEEPTSKLSAELLNAILTNSRYPEGLYYEVKNRICSENGPKDYIKFAIIKAFLLKKLPDRHPGKETLTVELNLDTEYLPYILGRVFAVLEKMQQVANRSVQSTIKDKYYPSACSTPVLVFPILMKLSNSHLRKMEIAKRTHYEKLLNSLMGKVHESFPKHLSMDDQGIFQIGYHHQKVELSKNKSKSDEDRIEEKEEK